MLALLLPFVHDAGFCVKGQGHAAPLKGGITHCVALVDLIFLRNYFVIMKILAKIKMHVVISRQLHL